MYKKDVGGRPLKFQSVTELEKAINKYFRSCWEQKIDIFGNPIFLKDQRGRKTNKRVMIQKEPYTVTDLATSLGVMRETLANYEKKDRFSATIKKAKQIIYGYTEKQLFIGKNPTGAIFSLKNNYGWKDKTETDIMSGGKPIVPLMGGTAYVPTDNGVPKNPNSQ